MSSPVSCDILAISAPQDDGEDESVAQGIAYATVDAGDVDLNQPFSLASFVPIIEQLPGLVLENGAYHITAPLLPTTLENFVAYVARVEELTLTDAQQEGDVVVSPGTITRLARIEDPDYPFLSSLKRLRVVDAKLSLCYTAFCVTPSLETLEISTISEDHHATISCFLKELAHYSPSLSSITLGATRLSSSDLHTIGTFTYLCHLHVDDVGKALDFKFLKALSGLPDLESLVIDARTACYTGCPASSSTSKTENNTDQPTSCPFPKLLTLTLVSNVLLMGNLFLNISPRAIKDVSLTLFREEGINRDLIRSRCSEQKTSEQSTIMRPSTATVDAPTKTSSIGITQKGNLKRHGAKLESRQQRLECQVIYFSYLIQKAIENGVVEKLAIGAVFPIPDFQKFPYDGLRNLLANRVLKRLEIKNWHIVFIDDALPKLSHSKYPPLMQTLLLPLENGFNPGIALTTLHSMARVYPNLTKLQTLVVSGKGPAFTVDIEQKITYHGLSELSIGGGSPWTKDPLMIATYIWFLFPNLKHIVTHEGYDAEDWKYIDRLVKMCQKVRAVEPLSSDLAY